MANIASGSVLGGKYRLESGIARTSSALLFSARDSGSGQAITVKLLLPMLARDHEERGRFEREFELMTKLKHQSIAQVFESGAAEDGTPFMTMEALTGEPLAKRVERGAMPPKDVLALTLQLLDGLRQAQSNRIVHRDLQPGSIFVSTRADGIPQAKIFSFGQARVEGQAASAAPAQQLTAYGTTLGAAEYMAPEQARGTNVDGRADIYSLGCTVYAMLTGQPPFPGKQTAQVMVRHLKEDPKSPAQGHPGIPPWFDMWVLRCLRKSPEERFATAGEAREVLENAMTTGFIPPPSHGAPVDRPSTAAPVAPKASPRPTPAPQAPRAAASVPVQPAAAAPRPSAAGPRPSKPEPHRVTLPAAPASDDDGEPKTRWPLLVAVGVALGILLAVVIRALG